MENKKLPSDHIPLLFIDRAGVSHEGIYNSALHAFVEKSGEEGPEDSGISYLQDEVLAWEYLEDKQSSDPDLMIIL